MTKLLFMALLVACCWGFLIATVPLDGEEKCCTKCELPEIKYYSLIHPRCGESCLDPKDYWKYKVFEPKMHKAETNTPCADFGYGAYEQTQIHSIGSLKVAVDLYLKPSK